MTEPEYLVTRMEQAVAALGAIRQDVRSLLSAVARLESIVAPRVSEVDCRVPGCNCHVKDWGGGSCRE